MPSPRALSQAQTIEYSLLHHTTMDGPVIGTYMDQPIAEAVIDETGRRYVYAGLVPRGRGGRFDTGALRPGEFILQPGLIYRGEFAASSQRGWLAVSLRKGGKTM
ncbi:MAG TPA: hypothetical protein VG848_10670 [Acetobacteraceae bacterium]|jgi:hypothetical protein|nr:hypothetical protein [Acetobacteraceae bacterium]